MSLMGVQCEQEGGTALDDADSGMGVAMDAAFVSFRETERPFQGEVVSG